MQSQQETIEKVEGFFKYAKDQLKIEKQTIRVYKHDIKEHESYTDEHEPIGYAHLIGYGYKTIAYCMKSNIKKIYEEKGIKDDGEFIKGLALVDDLIEYMKEKDLTIRADTYGADMLNLATLSTEYHSFIEITRSLDKKHLY